MNRAIDLIQDLIKEHEDSFCVDWFNVEEEQDQEARDLMAYDVGRYETLKQLLVDLMKMY